ncbi:7 transmembrane receptor [Dictyocaulus viviparus]|uniref:7 transmembrane receptor n=1 Tax=Dictyocaulus viviparus TaxID=29172 RepID=A0A0D8X8L7_DICVI|nr:7 transmembrane receptor [Dictyocaulus viviparus]
MNTEKNCRVYYVVFPDPSSSFYAIIPFFLIYLVLFILGLTGNILLIFVTIKNKVLQSVQNMFILNLAASDVMMCLLSLPITPVTNIFKNWFFGNVLCHLIPCIQGVSIFICTFSLAAIAVDRYILVIRPHTKSLSRKGALIVTIILWTLSFIVTLPYAFNMEIVDFSSDRYRVRSKNEEIKAVFQEELAVDSLDALLQSCLIQLLSDSLPTKRHVMFRKAGLF